MVHQLHFFVCMFAVFRKLENCDSMNIYVTSFSYKIVDSDFRQTKQSEPTKMEVDSSVFSLSNHMTPQSLQSAKYKTTFIYYLTVFVGLRCGTVWQGLTQLKSRIWPGLWYSFRAQGHFPSSQVTGRIQFLTYVGLRSLFSWHMILHLQANNIASNASHGSNLWIPLLLSSSAFIIFP